MVEPNELAPKLDANLEAFIARRWRRSDYCRMWGRNHNVGFHVVYLVGVAVSVFAIVWDFLGITKGASVIGLVGGAILAVPTAFKMQEKSMWYFECCNQIDEILSRLESGTLDHSRAVEEDIRLEKAMTDVWRAVTKSIDIRPIVEIARRRNR